VLATLAGCAALFLLVTALAGCAASRAHAPGVPTPAPLRVGTSSDYAPFSYAAADGALAGFDIEVARAYAADRGRTLELVRFRWPELAARLAAGDFDVAMSGVTVRADRLVTGTMTATVARAAAVLAVPVTTAAPTAPASPAHAVRAFDRADRTVAVNRGGHLEHVARARFSRARIVVVDDNTSLPALVARGEADAIVTDSLELAAFNARCTAEREDDAARDPHEGGRAPCLRVAAQLAHDRKAYWLPATGAALAADLDAWLLERERSGWLPALRARLLGNTATPALAAPAASLVEHVRRRLSLMALVAAAKRVRNLPIEDPAREDAIARDAAARAAAVGLDTGTFVAFVRAEIAAAKTVQRATPADAPAPFTLDELRRAIDRLDARIVIELAALTPLDAAPAAVVASLADTEIPGMSAAVARTLARALAGVRPQPDVFSTGCAPHGGGILLAVFDG
jgi:cyclohexadienyl dehydratase